MPKQPGLRKMQFDRPIRLCSRPLRVVLYCSQTILEVASEKGRHIWREALPQVKVAVCCVGVVDGGWGSYGHERMPVEAEEGAPSTTSVAYECLPFDQALRKVVSRVVDSTHT